MRYKREGCPCRPGWGSVDGIAEAIMEVEMVGRKNR